MSLAGTLTLREIPEGVDGIRVTLRRMAVLARSGIRDERILTLARQVTTGAPVADKAAEAALVFDWVVKNIRYVKDPVKIEFIMHPVKMLEVRAGDCDDSSILIASMLEAIGIPARFVAVRAYGSKGFSHVFTQGWIDGKWTAFDSANVAPRVGKMIPFWGEAIIQPVTLQIEKQPTLQEFMSGTTLLGVVILGLIGLLGYVWIAGALKGRSERAN